MKQAAAIALAAAFLGAVASGALRDPALGAPGLPKGPLNGLTSCPEGALC